jgi:hypothetical protein
MNDTTKATALMAAKNAAGRTVEVEMQTFLQYMLLEFNC